MDRPTNGRTDGRTDGPTDGHTLLKRCENASKNLLGFIFGFFDQTNRGFFSLFELGYFPLVVTQPFFTFAHFGRNQLEPPSISFRTPFIRISQFLLHHCQKNIHLRLFHFSNSEDVKKLDDSKNQKEKKTPTKQKRHLLSCSSPCRRLSSPTMCHRYSICVGC